jgi:hypothetical protein
VRSLGYNGAMPWYVIMFMLISLVLGAGMLAFIYFGLIRKKDESAAPEEPAP